MPETKKKFQLVILDGPKVNFLYEIAYNNPKIAEATFLVALDPDLEKSTLAVELRMKNPRIGFDNDLYFDEAVVIEGTKKEVKVSSGEYFPLLRGYPFTTGVFQISEEDLSQFFAVQAVE